jgi:hypothetical protein
MASYEDIRLVVIAVAQKSATITGARTQDGLTELVVMEKRPLLGQCRSIVRVFKEHPSREQLTALSNDLRLLHIDRGFVIVPSTQGDDPEFIPGIKVMDYESVLDQAMKLNLISSRSELGIKAEALSKSQAGLIQELHPLNLAQYLPSLSRGAIPDDLADWAPDPWDAFEDLIFLVFVSGFGLNAKREGHAARFEHKPEGYFLTAQKDGVVAMFDCKGTRKDKYKMEKDDELRFKNYISERKGEIETLENAELRYFLLFASDVGGDIEMRKKEILSATGIHLCIVLVSALADFGTEVMNRAVKYPNIIRLIDWTKMLSVPILNEAVFSAELVRIDQAARRY